MLQGNSSLRYKANFFQCLFIFSFKLTTISESKQLNFFLNLCSVSSLMTTTEAVVVSLPEKESSAVGAGMGGGMGGMDY